jgi:cyanophycinase
VKTRPWHSLTLAALALVALAGCGAPAGVPTALARQPVAAAARDVQLEAPMVFIGGGKDQDDVMRRIMTLAGGPDAPAVVVPLASGTPDKSGQAYVDYLRALGIPNASYVVPGASSTPADIAKVAGARAVFFSGGDQSKILSAFGPAWQQALKTARAKGCVVAGTSAGAMVWGQRAILGGDPLQTVLHGEDPAFGGIRLGMGLGLAPSLVVDTHFSERGRVPRLAYAVAKQPGAVGLGVDPATAAIVYADGRLEVAGRGTVTVVTVPAQPIKTPMSLKDMRVHLLAAGDTLGLNAEPVAR